MIVYCVHGPLCYGSINCSGMVRVVRAELAEMLLLELKALLVAAESSEDIDDTAIVMAMAAIRKAEGR